jgi:hypothetical protein
MVTLDTVRGLVRPLVTVLLITAQIALGFLWAFGIKTVLQAAPEDQEQAVVQVVLASAAFAGLSPFTMMAMTFWFLQRQVDGGGQ